MRTHQGSALAMMLVLLSGLGAIALAAAAAAMSALALAGHWQDARLAFEAAQAGIERALVQAAESRSAGDVGNVNWPGAAGRQAIYRTRTSVAVGAGSEPEGFSLGDGADTFSARQYFIVADAWAGRAAAVELEQGFYLVVPAP